MLSPKVADHEANRGLNGLSERIEQQLLECHELGMNPVAQVTISKLIRDYRALVPFLQDLGFEAIAFSYPQGVRLGSSSLAWSADSELVRFTDHELAKAFDQVDALREVVQVNNPHASLENLVMTTLPLVLRQLQQERDRLATELQGLASAISTLSGKTTLTRGTHRISPAGIARIRAA